MTQRVENRSNNPEMKPIPKHYGVKVGLSWGVTMFFLMSFLLEGGAFRTNWSQGVPIYTLVRDAIVWIGFGSAGFGGCMKWWAVRHYRRHHAAK